jgi:hypothetical protein
MQNNDSENVSTAQNPDDFRTTHRNWREQRHELRRERREARYRYPFRGLFLGLTLVLLGTLFMLHQFGWMIGVAWWQSLLVGLGIIFIIDGLVRYWSTEYRWGFYGKLVVGTVLILIGTLFILGFSQWWPLALIVAGIALVFQFSGRR